MSTRRRWLALLALAHLFAAVADEDDAPKPQRILKVREVGPFRFVGGGRSAAEIKELDELSPRFNVHLYFMREGNEDGVDEVMVRLRNMNRDVVLETRCLGSRLWLIALGGRFEVEAEFHGKVLRKTIEATGRRYFPIVLDFAKATN